MSDTVQEADERTQEDWSNRLAWFFTGAVIGVTAAIVRHRASFQIS